jgi:hypothetical protein
LAEAGTTTRADSGLRAALREARLSEAAHHEAVLSLRDSKSLRLQLLKDDLAPVVAATPEAVEVFDLALIAGEPPKLWIDLITFVVMEPDHRTYRIIEDRQNGREILFEGDDRAQAGERLRQHMAHRIIARQRQSAVRTAPATLASYSTGSVILAWLSGFSLGALALLGVAIYLEKLKF